MYIRICMVCKSGALKVLPIEITVLPIENTVCKSV
jgi:hypothetical protein